MFAFARALFGDDVAPVVAAAAVETFEVQGEDHFTNPSEHREAVEIELRRLQRALRYSDMSMLDEAKLVHFIEAVQTFKDAFKSTVATHPTAKLIRSKSDSRMKYTLEISNHDHSPLASVFYFSDL
jgi:hypothetical protein